ncbi:MAG TPA: carboxymuconolactone decarboxylase family protein [Burkholderiales bacterium]|nr:carboxymuconolactone decarboxylase family protein [Burkholderiales bacterium]
MPRIAYQPYDLQEPKELVEAIRARRGGRLLNLDRMLLYSPPLAKGWNGFLRAVRSELTLSPKLMEIAICSVATLNHAEYEFHHHAPELAKAGATQAQVDALSRLDTQEPDASLFDATERAVIRFTVEMTRDVRVTDATFSAVRAALGNDRLVVELTGVVAVYNMVSRVLVALDVQPE